MTKNSAFIGVSLDNPVFLTDWLGKALNMLVSKHESVTLVLADELLKYTRSTFMHGGVKRLELKRVNAFIEKRKYKLLENINNNLITLGFEQNEKIFIRSWGDFEDVIYCRLLRMIMVAYNSVEQFRVDVLDISHRHLMKISKPILQSELLNNSAFYILDEIAMAIRIAEFSDCIYEYYPGEEISPLKKLYNGEYESFGFTIPFLINGQPKRVFQLLV